MSFLNWRRSPIFRIVTFLILLDFLISQNLFAQGELHLQEGTHRYTPVKEVNADQLEAGGSGEKPASSSEFLPNPTDFWKDNPLSSPTPEVVQQSGTSSVAGQVSTVEGDKQNSPHPPSLPSPPRGEGIYDFNFYSFDQALDLIRPEFAAAGMAKNGAYGF